jgi:hypothetical protein
MVVQLYPRALGLYPSPSSNYLHKGFHDDDHEEYHLLGRNTVCIVRRDPEISDNIGSIFGLEKIFCLANSSAFQFYLQSGKHKRRVGRGQVMFLLAKSSLVKMEVYDGALSWCNSQVFCRQSSGRSLCTFSCSRCKTSQLNTELTVFACLDEFFMNNPLDV